MVSLGAGEHTATAWGCDLTYDYVKINGDYIWATFLGCSANEVIEDPEGRGYADLLLVFDKKDGLPLAKFKFPHKGGHICFSKDGKDLYHFTTDMNIDVVKVDELLDMIN